jgi:hypothetical protein
MTKEQRKFFNGFEPKSLQVCRHPSGCVTRSSDTCVWLADGTKITIKRGAATIGPAWLEVEPQAKIKAQ